MKRTPAGLGAMIVLGLLMQACGTPPAESPSCDQARRVAEEVLSLMRATGRDESTKLKQLVREGWKTSDTDLTIVRDVEVTDCQATAQDATVEARFEVLGRLIAPGRADGVRFEATPRSERRSIRLVDVDGVLKVDDISSLEPHVDPDYAIRILTELGESEPAAKEKSLALITAVRRTTESSHPQ